MSSPFFTKNVSPTTAPPYGFMIAANVGNGIPSQPGGLGGFPDPTIFIGGANAGGPYLQLFGKPDNAAANKGALQLLFTPIEQAGGSAVFAAFPIMQGPRLHFLAYDDV